MTAVTATTSKAPDAVAPTTCRKPIWRLVIEIILALLLVVGIPESIFALAGIGEQEYLRPDPQLGFVPMEGKSITWRSEGYSRTTLNRLGMPDTERSFNKPAGIFRIAIVGDSITMALEVDRKENYCQQLERMLNRWGQGTGQKFEVLNFSVSSYNMGQEYLMLKNRATKFHPDLVILPVRVDGVLHLATNPKGGFLYARPSFFVGPNGELLTDYTVQELWNKSGDSARIRNWSWFRRYSRIWGVLSTSIRPVFAFWEGWQQTFRSPLRLLYRPPGNQNADVSPAGIVAAYKPDPGSTRFLWPIADLLLKNIQKVCVDNDAKLLLVRLPATGHLHNDLETKLLEKSVANYGLNYFDLTPIFDRSVKNYFYVFHLIPEGHELVAASLFDYLTKSGMLRLH